MMMQVSSQLFGELVQDQFFRGVIRRGNEYRYTRRQFEDGGEAELYALALMLRARSIFEFSG